MISAEALKAIYQRGCQRCDGAADSLYTDPAGDIIICRECLTAFLKGKK